MLNTIDKMDKKNTQRYENRNNIDMATNNEGENIVEFGQNI